MINKLWSGFKKISGWFFAIMFFLFALVFMPSIASLIFVVAGVLILPVAKLQELIARILPKSKFKPIIATVLFIVGVFVAPQAETTTNDENIENSTVISETATDTTVLENTTETNKETAAETAAEAEQPVRPTEDQTEETTDDAETETEQVTPDDVAEESEYGPNDQETSEPAAETPLVPENIPSVESTQNETPQESSEPIVSSFSITYLDVGQADAAVVECDGQYMFIDTGNAADSDLIYSYINRNEIKAVEYVLLTHYHEDHIGGAQTIPRAASVGKLLVNGTTPTNDLGKETVEYYTTNNIPVEAVKAGDVFNLGSAKVEIYGPNGTYDNINDTSIVLKITYGNTSFLFTGDAENIAEADILDANYDISCDVIKIGHHGSANSTSSAWLKAAAPTYAVISVGEDNGNGHPTGEVLTRLRQAGIVTYRTDLQGDIVCVSDGENITFTVDKNADADTLAENSAGDYVEEVIEEVPPVEEKQEDTTTEPVVDEGRDYVVNKNTRKYHKPSCSSADDIKPHNRWDFHGTAEELEDMGYVACKRCKPY